MHETRFAVRFDEAAWDEDLHHASDTGAEVARQARDRLDQHGLRKSEVHACQAESREGLELPRCVKLYLPPPDGSWGAVLRLRRFDDELMLVVFAFGERHPLRTWRPNVYQLAHRRLHGSEPPTT